MSYVEVTVQVLDEWKDIVQAELHELGYSGIWDKGSELSAYIEQDAFNHKAVYDTLAGHGMENHFSYQILEDQNWNAVWEANFDPVEIDDRVIVRSPFHTEAPSFQHEIIIQPQMSFGTGHHETTRLVIMAMLGLNFMDKSVLDMGTGTGVLAVLAHRLGARHVVGIDNDLNSVENAQENLKYNTGVDVVYLHGSSDVIPDQSYDIVLSNITKNINVKLLPELVKRVCTGGTLVMAGFLNFDLDEVNQLVVSHNMQLERNISLGDWECLVYTKNSET
ncbi:MAG: 50S ribosomal protein L11 methyltransferase [Flavobacteriales bacterium]|nr:50S ribosomal protein L11 methyltransferase [Bacteroidota bacterium]MCB9239526.1 50S ribosomal protein L11 methyltransferase [Flavobacteriales bacterium]